MAGNDQVIRVDDHEIKLTNLDKVMYPVTGTTKGHVFQYYIQVTDLLIKHARNRPATRKRWPDGVAAEPFFEKNLPKYAPDWMPAVELQHSKRKVKYPLINNQAALLWLVQTAALELHVPQWQYDIATGTRYSPDRLVIDLDPGPGTGLPECCDVALAVRELLAKDGLTQTFAVTSGSKGMQLYSSLREQGPEDSNVYARELAVRLTESMPDKVLFNMTRAERTGKVFIDWSQNNQNKTTIAPYSLRGRDHPNVAAPRTWEEIETRNINQLSYQEVLERIENAPDPLDLDN